MTNLLKKNNKSSNAHTTVEEMEEEDTTFDLENRTASQAGSESAASFVSSCSNADINIGNFQTTIAQSFQEIQSYKEGGTKNIKITNAVIYMICCDYQPI